MRDPTRLNEINALGTFSPWHALRSVQRMDSNFAAPAGNVVLGSVDDLSATILRYVTSFPEARDTAEGVCEWWIPRQRHFDAMRNVLAALERLEAEGRIDAHRMTDGQVLYGAKASAQ